MTFLSSFDETIHYLRSESKLRADLVGVVFVPATVTHWEEVTFCCPHYQAVVLTKLHCKKAIKSLKWARLFMAHSNSKLETKTKEIFLANMFGFNYKADSRNHNDSLCFNF